MTDRSEYLKNWRAKNKKKIQIMKNKDGKKEKKIVKNIRKVKKVKK